MLSVILGETTFPISLLIVALLESGIFIGLALLTRRAPLKAIMGGIIIFIVFILLSIDFAYVSGGWTSGLKAQGSGILIRIFVLYSLIRAWQ